MVSVAQTNKALACSGGFNIGNVQYKVIPMKLRTCLSKIVWCFVW